LSPVPVDEEGWVAPGIDSKGLKDAGADDKAPATFSEAMTPPVRLPLVMVMVMAIVVEGIEAKERQKKAKKVKGTDWCGRHKVLV
jgi:hypothetical protein